MQSLFMLGIAGLAITYAWSYSFELLVAWYSGVGPGLQAPQLLLACLHILGAVVIACAAWAMR